MTIETELVKVTKIRPKGLDRATFLEKTMRALSDLTDDEFSELSEEAQGWFEDAVAGYNRGKKAANIPDFPDIEPEPEDDESEPEPEPEAKPSRRGRGRQRDPEPEPEAESEDDPEPEPEAEPEPPKRRGRPPRQQEPEEESEPQEPKRRGRPPQAEVEKPSSRTFGKNKPSAEAKKLAKQITKPKVTEKKRGAADLIRLFILKNPDITNNEIEAALKKQGSPATLQTIGVQAAMFRSTLKLLREEGWTEG